MSTISAVSVSPLAYKKLVLHTAKYPTARVFGLLLADTSSSQNVSIVDSIPLSHHWTALAPMAEVALSLATSYASSKNLSVVGVYEAPELVAERTPSQQAGKLAEKIAALAGREALLLFVDNAKLLDARSSALSGFAVSAAAGGKAEAKPRALQGESVTLQDQSTVAELEGAVRKQGLWEKIVDFDGKCVLTKQRRGCLGIIVLILLPTSDDCSDRPPRRSVARLAAERCHHCMILLVYAFLCTFASICIPHSASSSDSNSSLSRFLHPVADIYKRSVPSTWCGSWRTPP